MSRMGRCKGCGKQITWGTNERTGKSIPLDGPLSHTYRLVVMEGDTMVIQPQRVWQSHFLTCPQADKFSRSKKEGRDDN